jgi:flagellar basal-body rod protein FlgF
MVKGLYTACEGMKANLRKQEVISNNLANVNTTGFKKSELFTRTYLSHVKNDLQQPFLNDEHTIDEVVIDFSPGALVATGNPLDAAIEGESFFTVIMPDNSLRYTRSGAFTIDGDGQLSTLHGEKLLGQSGRPIDVNGKSAMINESGEVLIEGRSVDKLKMTQFNEPCYLLKRGYGLYEKSDKTEEIETGSYKIRQGHLEGSNVNPIESMVKMISGLRNYEADERAMQSEDQTLSKAVNEVGRIR